MGLIVYYYMGIWGGDGDKSSSTDPAPAGSASFGGPSFVGLQFPFPSVL